MDTADNVVPVDFPAAGGRIPLTPPYAELQVASNYSFLRGASSAEKLVGQAISLGLSAIGIADRNTLAGVVRAHVAAKTVGLRLLVGARLDFEDGPSFLCYPTDRDAYGRLTRLLTRGKKRTQKGKCQLFLADILENGIFECGRGQVMILLAPDTLDTAFKNTLAQARNQIKNDLYLSVNYLYYGDDKRRLAELAQLGERHGIPLLATNDVHAHTPDRRPLQDVMTCIREGCTIKAAGLLLFANAERHLKPPAEMTRLFRDYPDAIENTLKVVETSRFSLDEMKTQYLVDPVPRGKTHQGELGRLVWEGVARRCPHGARPEMEQQIREELALIAEQGYAPYFLTIHDIVWWARGQGILCQGRGSAANSTVCYVLGITEVDPIESGLLFARFMSTERIEPPDIDVDFEHERREEVIQHIYEKYGRDRAALTATVITYRTKSALRDVGKVMGLSEDTIVALQKSAWGRGWGKTAETDDEKKLAEAEERKRLREAGINPNDRTVRQTLTLVRQLAGAPRHLSQHTGGFVITRAPLDSIVPIENAAMKDRTVIEWDKDDLAALEIFKIDILALGMLTCIRKAFDLIEACHGGERLTLDSIPQDDVQTYNMLCEADSIGVFQVESRAQMNMLPRLKPEKFYDLVVEVAIVRPGPIQGGMVHPYLRRKQKLEKVDYPSKELEDVLKKTLGVPLFQEQAMKIAMVGAGFTAQEADKLRRSMAAFRRNGDIDKFHAKFMHGMDKNGYTEKFANDCFEQIKGFADYGFPEAHAASFAKLVYVSAWLKCHYPAAFAAAILNSQPMGFYAPAQLVRDARQHGVAVLPVDVNRSDWDCTLEPVRGAVPALEDAPQIGDPAWPYPDDRKMAVRLGMRSIKGMDEDTANAISNHRDSGYEHMSQILNRVAPKVGTLEKLARADAFTSLNLDRRRALWAVKGIDNAAPLPLFKTLSDIEIHPEAEVTLPEMSLGEQVADDYRALKLSLKAHPMKLLRGTFDRDGVLPCGSLLTTPDGTFVRAAGLVLIRQRPGEGTVIFITIEDETGIANIIVWNHMMERFRKEVLTSSLLYVEGKLQREGIVTHIVAERLVNRTQTLGYLTPRSPADREPIKGDPPRGGAKLIPSSRDFH
ncbi:MAG: dnaE [Rhodospirillales bacterium]|nr:dnaE [Rhodospirillales bacterium]